MSRNAAADDSVEVETGTITPPKPGRAEPFPFDRLARCNRDQIRMEHRLRRVDPLAWFGSFASLPNVPIEIGAAEVLWRASGIHRTAIVAQFVWPGLSTRIGLGIDATIGHELVDRLLQTERRVEEYTLAISPVEWGILSYCFADWTEALRKFDSPVFPYDLLLDRVGPEPFDFESLARIITIRWPIRLGSQSGSIRLWLPETLVGLWLSRSETNSGSSSPAFVGRPVQGVEAVWRAEIGKINVGRGLRSLRVGGVLPIAGETRTRTIESPGLVQLTCQIFDPPTLHFILAEVVSESKGKRLELMSTPRTSGLSKDPSLSGARFETSDPLRDTNMDAPVTLIVELGKVNIPLSKLADLKPGDVIELHRHSREPIELTSGGRTIARGELVQIDEELGVRVTNLLI